MGAPRWPYAARHTAGAVMLLLLSACAPPPLPAAPPPASSRAQGPALGVLREGWHTGLIVPEAELSGPLRPLRVWFAHAPFVVIGWGERRYYMARRPGLLTGLAALFPSRSVIHVRAWRPEPRLSRRPGQVSWLRLVPADWRGLRTFLGRAFAQTPHDRLEVLGAHGRRGLFFAATGTYDALHTCNTWTMEALRAAGLPAASAGVLFASQVRAALRAAPLRRFRAVPPVAAPAASPAAILTIPAASPIGNPVHPR